MKVLIASLITLSVAFTSLAQDYNSLKQSADSLYKIGDFKASAEYYEKAFLLKDESASDRYSAACSRALAGDTINAIMHMHKAAALGWSNIEWMNKDADLQSIRSSNEWKVVEEVVFANKAEKEKYYNHPLKDQLEEIYMKDQMLRQLYPAADKSFGTDSREMKYFWSLMKKEDEANVEILVQIINKNGWPGIDEVGGKANAAVWLVIQHASVEIQEQYLPLLEKSVADGQSSGSHLALLKDRILMRNGKDQIYGSQVITNDTTGKKEFYPIKDPSNVNARRAEVGLGTIEDYANRMGVEM